MKVTKKDLTGRIEGFPIEVVEKILEHMKEQGVGGIKELQEEGRCALGWSDTSEGYDFWREIFWNNNWDHFFERYPKEKKQSFIIKLFKRLFRNE